MAKLTRAERRRLKRQKMKELKRTESEKKVKASTRNKIIYSSIIAVTILVVVGFVYMSLNKPEKNYDDLAKCLTEKGFKLYGSYECSHCWEQKELFRDAAEFVDYVECGPLGEPAFQECQDAGVSVYPTWVTPTGAKLVGVQSLSKLSEMSGCELTKA